MNSRSLLREDSDATLSDGSELNFDSEKEDAFEDDLSQRRNFRNDNLDFSLRRSMVIKSPKLLFCQLSNLLS